MSDAEKIRELRAALGNLMDQVDQMSGLFKDDDGALERAVKDGEYALSATEGGA